MPEDKSVSAAKEAFRRESIARAKAIRNFRQAQHKAELNPEDVGLRTRAQEAFQRIPPPVKTLPVDPQVLPPEPEVLPPRQETTKLDVFQRDPHEKIQVDYIPPSRKDGTEWTVNHRKAAVLRAKGDTWATIAKTLGVAYATAYAWGREPGFGDLVAAQVSHEGRRLLERSFIPIMQEMIGIALNRERDESGEIGKRADVEPKDQIKAAYWVADVAKRFNLLQPGVSDPDGNGAATGQTQGGKIEGAAIRVSAAIEFVRPPPARLALNADGTAYEREDES